MQAQRRGERQRGGGIHAQRRAGVVVGPILGGDDRVQAIIAPGQLDQHQDPVADRSVRGVGRRGHDPIGEDGGHRGAGKDRQQALLQEVAAAEHGSIHSIQLS
ncbi:MAG TPA: hypothetical protein VJO72_05105 [Candidatus Dormibacteraeota bacterium]|nr:hypothetical protein [Candidatus Dormibacteraeota bacterium]